MHMLNGTWPQIRQIKTRQSLKFLPSKITRYTVIAIILFHINLLIYLLSVPNASGTV